MYQQLHYTIQLIGILVKRYDNDYTGVYLRGQGAIPIPNWSLPDTLVTTGITPFGISEALQYLWHSCNKVRSEFIILEENQLRIWVCDISEYPRIIILYQYQGEPESSGGGSMNAQLPEAHHIFFEPAFWLSLIHI